MALDSGTRLGPYEILAPIGAGGMGEVYRARDTKLGRDVAIKVLPEEFSQDKERLDRFEREAQLLAALNHPNIATLHGLEKSVDTRFLVMEFVTQSRRQPSLRRRTTRWTGRLCWPTSQDRLTKSSSRGMSTLWPRIGFLAIRSTAVYV